MAIRKYSKQIIVGLNDSLLGLQENIDAEALERANALGVQAQEIEELGQSIETLEAGADDFLRKDDNLESLADAAVARANLEVMSTNEVSEAITTAALALGTNHTVADIAARDALEGLTTDDRVHVRDVGDGTWGKFSPEAVDAQGKATGWLTLTTQAALEAEMTNEQIKTAYESNDDTNAFTDEAKTKVEHITVTEAVDLDDVQLRENLADDLAVEAPEDEAPTAAAAKAYADEAARTGGVEMAIENLVVTANQITLANAPKGGKNGILNFASVLFVDAQGQAFHAPVVGTGDAKVFGLSLDTAGEWDGETVKVQYAYVPAND